MVPVYPGATYDGAMGGSTSEDIGGPAISEGTSWFFKVEDPVEDMVDFYREELPGARRSDRSHGQTSAFSTLRRAIHRRCIHQTATRSTTTLGRRPLMLYLLRPWRRRR